MTGLMTAPRAGLPPRAIRRVRSRLAGAGLATLVVACGATSEPVAAPSPAATAPAVGVGVSNAADSPAPPWLELYESFPVETSLDHPDIAEAHDAWVRMIDAAVASLDIAQFYVSTSPGSRLEPVLAAIERAAARGVVVRILVDERFYAKYPEPFERLRRVPGVEGRRLDVGKTSGGVHHAKYFVVDGREVYLGSHNFDWRALEHIQELGLRIRSAEIAGALLETFELDWAAAAAPGPVQPPTSAASTGGGARWVRGDGGDVALVMSPKVWLAHPEDWDLPHLLRAFDTAARTIEIQLLSYRTTSYDGSPFLEIDDALRRAAARGVRVRLMVSDWADEPRERAPLLALMEAGVLVRLVSIPPWSGGPIEFARTIHAKYVVIDGDLAWLGTSNFSGDYFYKSRNVGVLSRGPKLASRLERFFETGWTSPYTSPP